ncbi:MAG: DUF5779 family protein [Halobacteriaceae archaeon]
MSNGFELDLRRAEEEIQSEIEDTDEQVVLGILNGTTDPNEWIEEIQDGRILVLSVEGDLNKLAAPWAADVKDDGATLMRFREFLIVTPPSIEINTDRL